MAKVIQISTAVVRVNPEGTEEVELFALDDAGNIFRKNWGGKGGSEWAKLPTVPTGG